MKSSHCAVEQGCWLLSCLSRWKEGWNVGTRVMYFSSGSHNKGKCLSAYGCVLLWSVNHVCYDNIDNGVWKSIKFSQGSPTAVKVENVCVILEVYMGKGSHKDNCRGEARGRIFICCWVVAAEAVATEQSFSIPRSTRWLHVRQWHLTVVLQTMICCRIAFVMMQYSIMANSYWLLLEGIYLHNLLVITVFTERNYFKIYLCIGWGELARCACLCVCFCVIRWMQNMWSKYDCWCERNLTHKWVNVNNCHTCEHKGWYEFRLFCIFTGMPLLFLVPWVMAKYWYENHL